MTRDLLQRYAEASGRIVVDGDVDGADVRLVYFIDGQVRFDAALRIERSGSATLEPLRRANPGGWQAIEWNELLDGQLGPWTMALDGERVVSICHTPWPATVRVAECGVWTDPEYRGRGNAAAVTAAWAALLRASGRDLFYSTSSQNLSSQRVAERLRLHLLGRVRIVGERHDDRVHPLSSLRRR